MPVNSNADEISEVVELFQNWIDAGIAIAAETAEAEGSHQAARAFLRAGAATTFIGTALSTYLSEQGETGDETRAALKAFILGTSAAAIGVVVVVGSPTFFTFAASALVTSLVVNALDTTFDLVSDRFGFFVHGVYDFSAAVGNTHEFGSNRADIMIGGDFKDTFFGRNANDRIEGNSGNDTLWGMNGSDSLFGGTGEDYLYGGGDQRRDTLNGGSGDDYLDGGFGRDSLVGGLGSDSLVFRDDRTLIHGGNGNDWLLSAVESVDLRSWRFISVENISLSKAVGSALIARNATGDAQDNRIDGNFQNNRIEGLGGDDFLYGFAGNDTLAGGKGHDYLNGGSSGDVLTGGTGNDTYVVDSRYDTVVELANEGRDKVEIDGAARFYADHVEVVSVIDDSRFPVQPLRIEANDLQTLNLTARNDVVSLIFSRADVDITSVTVNFYGGADTLRISGDVDWGGHFDGNRRWVQEAVVLRDFGSDDVLDLRAYGIDRIVTGFETTDRPYDTFLIGPHAELVVLDPQTGEAIGSVLGSADFGPSNLWQVVEVNPDFHRNNWGLPIQGNLSAEDFLI